MTVSCTEQLCQSQASTLFPLFSAMCLRNRSDVSDFGDGAIGSRMPYPLASCTKVVQMYFTRHLPGRSPCSYARTLFAWAILFTGLSPCLWRKNVYINRSSTSSPGYPSVFQTTMPQILCLIADCIWYEPNFTCHLYLEYLDYHEKSQTWIRISRFLAG